MIEPTLTFLRGDAMGEESKIVGIATILETVSDQLADTGHDLVLTGLPHASIRCKPLAIKRVLSNLVENAVKYGVHARVALAERNDEIVITIADDGPGDSGSVRSVLPARGQPQSGDGRHGLGLDGGANHRSRARRDIRLHNRQPRGLCATVTLPETTDL